MAHKKKTKEDKNLVWIEKKSEEDSSLDLAFDVLQMYDNGFDLTIKDISSILLCDRQWVVKNVKDNVKHIFLNETYRRFLNNICAKSFGKEIYFGDYYYFSRDDFNRWLKENTSISRQTIEVDLLSYCQDKVALEKRSKEYKVAIKNCSIFEYNALKSKYLEDLYGLMNKKGKKYFDSIVNVAKRKAKEVPLDDVGLPEEFVSIKVLKEEMDRSLEIVYRKLYKVGALKYTIANSLVRYDRHWDHKERIVGESFFVTIPYEIYIE